MLSDQKILDLFQDPNFMGSFSGVSNFQHFLRTDYGENVPKQKLYQLLKTLPNYIYQLRSPTHYATRSYQVDSFGKLLEMDLAFLKPFRVSTVLNFLIYIFLKEVDDR